MAKKKEVVITCNATNVKAVIEGLERGMAALAKEEEKLLNTIKQRGYAENDEKKRLKELEKAMDAMRTNVQKNREEQKKLAEVMKDLSGAKLKDLKKALQEGKAALNNMSARDPNREKLVHDLQRIQKQIETNTGALKSHGSAWQSAVKNITAYVGVFGAFNFVKNKITEVIRGGEELSDQMAQVRMVSGLAMEDIEDLTRTLAKMDTRTTLSELERIAYAGAKLGFGEYGTKGLEEFVRAANQVNVALREDLGEEALTALSKITENMGLIKKMGVEDAMLATSSAMFKLAATSTAAAGPIVEVTKRLVPVAQASGMATHEILALASASDSLQLMPEVVGTALSKLLMAMQNNHNLIEQTLGIDEGTIARMIKAGDVMDAMLMIFDKMSGKNMTELSGIWKLLGSDGQRLITVVQAMANHTDTLRKHLETSTQAFKEATAVTEEYNIQQETAAALMQRASNLWRNAMVNADTSLSVKEMAKSWYDFSKSVLDSEFSLGAIKVTIDALLGSIRLLINLLPMIAFGLMAKGAAMLAVKLSTAKMAVDGFTLSWKKMDAATKANWISLAIGLFAQLAFSIAQWAKSNEEAEASQRKLNQALDSAADKAEQEINAMSRLKAQVEDTSLSQEERMKMFSKFKTDYDIYLNYLGIELKSVDELAKHYDALTKVMRQRFAYQEREDYKRDVLGGEEGLRMQRRSAGSKLVKSGTAAGVNIDLGTIDTLIGAGKSAAEIRKALFPQTEDNTPVGAYANPNAATLRNPARNRKNDAVWDALVGYVNARLSETTKEQDIDAAFAQEIGDFDYDKWLRTQVKGDFKLKPDKAAIAAAKKAAQDHKKAIAERKRALKAELKEAENEAQAIIDKIGEWYTLQESVVEGAVADGEKTRKEADRYLKDLNESKHKTLSTARKSIAGKITVDDWKKLVDKVMPENASIKDYWMAYVEQELSRMMADQGAWSSELAGEIAKTDLQWIYKLLSRFNGSSDVLGITSTASFDKIMKGAAMDEREIAKSRAATAEEVDKILLEYKYIEQAQRSFHENLVGLGIMRETYEEYVQRIKAEAKKSAASVTQDADIEGGSLGFNVPVYAKAPKSPEDQLLEQFLKHGVKPYMVNPENDEELYTWLQNLMSNYDYDEEDHTRWHTEEWVSKGFPQLEDWINDIDKYRPEIQKFYFSLIQWEDEYYEATKKNYEREKKLLGERWDRSGYGEAFGNADKSLGLMKRDKALIGAEKGTTFNQMAGFDTLKDDPEIAASMLRMEQARQELELAKQVAKDKQLIREQQHAYDEAEMALQEQIMDKISERISKLQQWTEPINSFAATVGDAAGKAIRDNENMSEQVQEALKNMVKAYGDSTIKIVSELMIQRVKKRMIGLAMAKDTKATQEQETEIAEEGGEQRMQAEDIVQTGIASITQQMGQQILATKQQQDAQETEMEGQKARGGIMAGIAEGAAKIIGSLGWWGIPLIAVITALLNGLLSMALSALFGSGKSKTSSTANLPKTKIASGMLTYDKGNIDRFAGRRLLYDDGTTQVYGRRRYLGEDGKVYTATAEPAPKDGLITHPIATTVQGQPALVAENGPEIVIGRETTKAIMMNEPELIKYLANYQQHGVRNGYRPYDSGTLPATVPDGSPSGDTADREALLRRLDKSDELMAQVLYYLQHPPRPKIDMYSHGGEDGLYDSMQKATKFMSRYGG